VVESAYEFDECISTARIGKPARITLHCARCPLGVKGTRFDVSPRSSEHWGFEYVEPDPFFPQPRYPEDRLAWARAFIYDDLNRVISTLDYDDLKPRFDDVQVAGGYATSTDFNGFVQTHVNAKSQRRIEHRDALNRIQRVTDDVSRSTDFGYDTFGNLTRTVDPNGNVIQVMYDSLGRRTRLTDPNLGRIDYFPDARGLLWRQQSPRQRAAVPAQFSRMEYDRLGRMTGRYEPDLESHWVFDTATKGVGQLAEAYTGTPLNKDYRRIHTYDSLGRPSTTTQILSDGSYVQSSEYDDWGRKITETLQRVPSPTTPDPAKVFQARYNGWGYLAQWQRAATTTPTLIPARVLWRQVAANARQQATIVRYGNGLSETNRYDAHANRLLNRSVDTVAQQADDTARLNESYLYDALGNVNTRTVRWDTVTFTESFTYDTLNRLISSQVNGQALQTFEYDAVGNLTRKTGVGAGTSGSMIYPPQGANSVRPNALSSVTGGTFGTGTYSYDANGNLIAAPGGRTGTWTSFDMPLSMAKGSVSSTFTYGPEHQRTKQVRGDGTVITYAGAQEVETTSGGARTVKTYWPMGLGVEIDRPATGSPPVAPATQLSWWHKDRLGSVIAITSDTGIFRERLAFDAWGKRRTLTGSLSGTTPTPDTIDGVIDNRGYTGHEMLDQLDLVHMNGRIYDPLTARFMSADPILQDPMNAQSYNRYSYVLNNPTNLTDPTGFCAKDEAGYGSRICGSVAPNAFGGGTSVWKALPSDKPAAPISEAARRTAAAFTTPTKTGDGFFKQSVKQHPPSGTGEGDIVKTPSSSSSFGVRQAIKDRADEVVEGHGYSVPAKMLGAGGRAAAAVIPDNPVETVLAAVPVAAKFLQMAAKWLSAEREVSYLYRGVHAAHPALDAAKQGRIVPGNLNGTVSAEAHNMGGVAAHSPFTSWTRDAAIAAQHAAKHGPGGVVLRVPQGAPPAGASWSWQWSPDVWRESEVLLRGVRTGAEVIK
jgi:RHS repeat-associated protein